jgi:hypothetical protein
MMPENQKDISAQWGGRGGSCASTLILGTDAINFVVFLSLF